MDTYLVRLVARCPGGRPGGPRLDDGPASSLYLASGSSCWPWAYLRRGAVQGLRNGKTLALDNITLFFEPLGLVGRPECLVQDGDHVILEEWKSSKRLG